MAAPTRDEILAFLVRNDAGSLIEWRLDETRDGIERIAVRTTKGDYLIAWFESSPSPPFFVLASTYLARRGIACAAPLPDRLGLTIQPLGDRMAVLLACPGTRPDQVTAGECAQIGEALGRIHVVGRAFGLQRTPPRGLAWMRTTGQNLLARLHGDDAALLEEELRLQGLYRFTDLPHGFVHGDLGRRAVTFVDGTIAVVSSFEFACTDVLLLDVAGAVNAWCSDANGNIDGGRAGALLAGYDSVRPLTALERGAWPMLLRAVALCAWLGALATGAQDAATARAALASRGRQEYELRAMWPKATVRRRSA